MQFEEYKKGSIENTNSVWKYFLREIGGQKAMCKKCKKAIKCSGGSTSVLHCHLRTMHNINISKRRDDNDNTELGICEPKKTITEYFPKLLDESLSAVLSRMSARDGLPFSIFCTSDDLRMLLIAKGFRDIPKSPTTIRNLVVNYGKYVCGEIKKNLLNKKKNGNLFSLTFDEWTSVRNRRYLNINIHINDEFWNLGLIRISGSLPAEKCVELLKVKLSEYSLYFKDIACITTDGASMMRKVGRLLEIEQQLCFAHGIQLAVLSVLYPKNFTKITEHSDSDECSNLNPVIIESDEDDNYEDKESFDISFDYVEYEQTAEIITHIHLLPLIMKVRKVVKLFRRSPTKNDILQNYVKIQFGSERNLILDSKTRWSSLIMMLERFYVLRSCIQKSLIDLKTIYLFSEQEFTLLSEIISVLLPVKLAVESLCRQDSSLLTADATFNFLLTELQKNNTAFSHEIKLALLNRIKERRTPLSSLLQYLHNRYNDAEKNENSDFFSKLNKAEVIKIIVSLLQRTTITSIDDTESITDLQSQEEKVKDECAILHDNLIAPTSENLLSMMNSAIEKLLNVPSFENKGKNVNITTKIRRELAIYEDEGIRGYYLELVYKLLLTIPPTSVEAERAFSSAGLICTKIRSRLSDESINILCILRAHFIKNRK